MVAVNGFIPRLDNRLPKSMSDASHHQQLLVLLADGSFHSGSHLASHLGLSRTAIWKLLHELQGLGLEVNAVKGKGYCLAKPLELLDKTAIMAGLSDSAKAHLTTIEIHGQIDSTNTHLMEMSTSGARAGTVCLAEY